MLGEKFWCARIFERQLSATLACGIARHSCLAASHLRFHQQLHLALDETFESSSIDRQEATLSHRL